MDLTLESFKVIWKNVEEGNSLTIITYGMGVHWAINAAKDFEGQIEIVDLRTIAPIDEATIFASVQKNSRCIVLTEEAINCSFAQSLAGRIQEACFTYLDAPVISMGAENTPAIPLNSELEKAYLPSAEKLKVKIEELLNF